MDSRQLVVFKLIPSSWKMQSQWRVSVSSSPSSRLRTADSFTRSCSAFQPLEGRNDVEGLNKASFGKPVEVQGEPANKAVGAELNCSGHLHMFRVIHKLGVLIKFGGIGFKRLNSIVTTKTLLI